MRIGRSELPAGGVAAVAFAVLVFALELNLLFATALAAAVYLGVVLVWPPGPDRPLLPADDVGAPERVAYEEALTLAAALQAQADQIIKVDVRARVVQMLVRADRILVAMNEDGNLAAASVFGEGWLRPLHGAVTEYVRLSGRDVKSARARADKVESCHLARFEAAVDAFDEELNRASEIDPAALWDALESSLRGLDTLASTQESPELSAAAHPDPTDSFAATGSFAPGDVASQNAARLGLTRREHEIVILLTQSHPMMTDKELAAALFITFRTAGNHVANILDKLGLKSRREIPAFAAKHGLLPHSRPDLPAE